MSNPQQKPAFETQPLSPVMAAEVTALDLAEPFDPATQDAVYEAFLRYQLLVFRDQDLDKDQ